MSSHYIPLKIKTSKTVEKTLSETSPNVIGEGTYGCVHRPSLRCKNKPKMNYKDKISKLGDEKEITSELNEYKLIHGIDKFAFFYPGKPDGCSPENDPPTLEAINKCKDFESSKIEKYKLLVMRDGGEDLENFAKNEKMRVPSKIERF